MADTLKGEVDVWEQKVVVKNEKGSEKVATDAARVALEQHGVKLKPDPESQLSEEDKKDIAKGGLQVPS